MIERVELQWSEVWQLTTTATPASLSVLLEAQRLGTLERTLERAAQYADADERITLARHYVLRRQSRDGRNWGV